MERTILVRSSSALGTRDHRGPLERAGVTIVADASMLIAGEVDRPIRSLPRTRDSFHSTTSSPYSSFSSSTIRLLSKRVLRFSGSDRYTSRPSSLSARSRSLREKNQIRMLLSVIQENFMCPPICVTPTIRTPTRTLF